MYNRVLENIFWAEPRIRCNCGSYALGVDSWFWPTKTYSEYNERVEEIKSLYNAIDEVDNDIKYKKLLINTLINKIYLYDDNIIIVFI